jgi:hypothetical protein
MKETLGPIFPFAILSVKNAFQLNRKQMLFARIGHLLPDNENRWFYPREKDTVDRE